MLRGQKVLAYLSIGTGSVTFEDLLSGFACFVCSFGFRITVRVRYFHSKPSPGDSVFHTVIFSDIFEIIMKPYNTA